MLNGLIRIRIKDMYSALNNLEVKIGVLKCLPVNYSTKEKHERKTKKA